MNCLGGKNGKEEINMLDSKKKQKNTMEEVYLKLS